MTSFKTIKTLSICTLLALSAACGGATVDEAAADDLAAQGASGPYEPFAHFAAVKKVASRYTTSPVAISLHGALKPGAAQPDSGAYTWTWTLMGSDGIFVDVEAGPAGNKTLAHEKRYCFAGQGSFEPRDVPVDGNDVVQLVLKAGLQQPGDLLLGAGLARPMTPRWTATAGSKSVQVDALSGDVTSN